jgi:hypothetical protein
MGNSISPLGKQVNRNEIQISNSTDFIRKNGKLYPSKTILDSLSEKITWKSDEFKQNYKATLEKIGYPINREEYDHLYPDLVMLYAFRLTEFQFEIEEHKKTKVELELCRAELLASRLSNSKLN